MREGEGERTENREPTKHKLEGGGKNYNKKANRVKKKKEGREKD